MIGNISSTVQLGRLTLGISMRITCFSIVVLSIVVNGGILLAECCGGILNGPGWSIMLKKLTVQKEV